MIYIVCIPRVVDEDAGTVLALLVTYIVCIPHVVSREVALYGHYWCVYRLYFTCGRGRGDTVSIYRLYFMCGMPRGGTVCVIR